MLIFRIGNGGGLVELNSPRPMLHRQGDQKQKDEKRRGSRKREEEKDQQEIPKTVHYWALTLMAHGAFPMSVTSAIDDVRDDEEVSHILDVL
jgi:hypothetical protein